MDFKNYPTLQRLVNKHDKQVEKFQNEASKLFHSHAVKLCKRIRKGLPGFTGCMLAMRRLYLEPRDLPIKMVNPEDGECTEKLNNVMEYITIKQSWTVNLPDDTLEALEELDKLADYIDDNYSNVNELHVDLNKEK